MAIKTSALTHSAILRAYGVSRNMIRHVMLNCFHPGQDYRTTEGPLVCKLKHMTGEQFKNHLTNGQLKNPQNSLLYTVIYQGCTPYHVKRAHEVLCSFRNAQDDLALEPIVIVRISKENVL